MADIERYFAAANSGEGFYSFFGEVFDRKQLDKIYLLRGGPGTGKSTLMKKIGKRAEAEGLSVHYVPCSSDIDSLDGVIIPEKSTAIFDATAPHSAEPSYPGAVEVTAELYPALSTIALCGKRDEIIAFSDTAKRETTAAGEYLSAAARMKREAITEAKHAFDSEKPPARQKGKQRRFPSAGRKAQVYKLDRQGWQKIARYISAPCKNKGRCDGQIRARSRASAAHSRFFPRVRRLLHRVPRPRHSRISRGAVV